jgi:hypothetical protein
MDGPVPFYASSVEPISETFQGLISVKLVLFKAFLLTGMADRWELTEKQWKLMEPDSRPVRGEDGRDRPWH